METSTRSKVVSATAGSERDLRDAVDAIAARALPGRGRVTELIRMHSSYRSTYPIDELSVGFTDGSSMQMVFKDLSPLPLKHDGAPRRIRPGFLCDAQREIAAYRQILEPGKIGAPRFYGAVEDEKASRHWLFLEDVQGKHLWQFGFEPWLEAAQWLAGMHRRFEGRAGEFTAVAPLLRYDEEYFALWVMRAAEFHPSLRAMMAPYQRRVVPRLSQLSRTFIHGEFYASNVLMQESPFGLLVRPLDWEMSGVGSGLLDLAALVAGAWSEAQRRAMACAYYEAYARSGPAPALARFLEDLEFCRLHLAMQWLGWSQQWTPPREPAQDWMRDAQDLARRLGVS